MPITYREDLAIFDAACTIEEAEPLLAWLKETPTPRMDLSACEHLHAAVFQLLYIHRPALAAAPSDPFLRERILPFLTAPASTPTESPGSVQPFGSDATS